VEDGVGRPTDGHLQRDCVLEGLLREEIGGATAFGDDLDGESAGALGLLVTLLVLGGRGGRTEWREAQRLRDGGHGVGGEHPATGAGAGAGVSLHLVEFVLGHIALGDRPDALEDVLDGDPRPSCSPGMIEPP